MTRLRGGVLALCVLAWTSAPARAALPAALRACGDAAEFPPYVYFERQGTRRSDVVAGLDVDVLQHIATLSGHRITVELLPWARCVLLGARGQYDIVLDGVRSPQRDKDFLFAPPHYALTPLFLYLTARPKPAMHTKRDIGKLRICSQADYNYEPYGVPNALISNRAATVEASAQMLKAGRCDVLIYVLEILRGRAAQGGADLLHDPEVGQEVPGWLKHIDFHFMVGRALPYRHELLDLLERGIDTMKHDGELERLQRRHGEAHVSAVPGAADAPHRASQ